MKRLFSILAASVAFFLAGCAGIPGATEITAVATTAVDALTGPDTDYKNYLSHCRAEVKAQADALKSENDALAAGLSSGNKETQYGATLIMAFKAGQGGQRIGCTVARKKGAVELLLGEGDLLQLGVDLYRENRAGARFNRQLEADKEMTRDRQRFELEMEERRNRFTTTLTGDELELMRERQKFELDRRRLDQQAPLPTPE